jgi:predicted RNA-binding Zn-ribbon protein involved in translation (DUF1610 family)
MTIRFSCPCGKQFQVRDQEAGKQGKCPSCGTKLLVPTPEQDRTFAEGPPLLGADLLDSLGDVLSTTGSGAKTSQGAALTCPKCHRPLPPLVTSVCVNCGFDLKKSTVSPMPSTMKSKQLPVDPRWRTVATGLRLARPASFGMAGATGLLSLVLAPFGPGGSAHALVACAGVFLVTISVLCLPDSCRLRPRRWAKGRTGRQAVRHSADHPW